MENAQKAEIPTFKAQYVPEPAPFVEAGFLTGDFGRETIKQLDAVIAERYGNNNFLRGRIKYDEEAKVMTGSSALLVPLVQSLEIIQNAGLEVVTPADMEYLVRNGDPLGIKGKHYVDTGVVWRSADEPNKYFAEYLARNQIAHKSAAEAPILFSLASLGLEVDNNSPYGVVFKQVKPDNVFYGLKILNEAGNFNSEDIDPNTGIPTKVGDGNRTLYTINSGLSGLYLSRYLSLVARFGDLADSRDGGRVVVVRRNKAACGAPENSSSLDKLVA